MKKFLLFVGIICLSYTVSAQSHKTISPQLTEVEDGLYEVTFENDDKSISQIGYYKVMDNELVKHGIWKMYSNDKVISKAKFEDDELQWLKSNGETYTSKDIELLQLRNRVKILESSIVMRD